MLMNTDPVAITGTQAAVRAGASNSIKIRLT
jgi:hypothetical protein